VAHYAKRLECGAFPPLSYSHRRYCYRLTAEQPTEVSFAVKNVSAVPLSLCSPSDVSTYLRPEQATAMWPIVIHGWTTDTACSGPFALAPGEEHVFVERGGVSRDLAEVAARLVGRISLYAIDGSGFAARKFGFRRTRSFRSCGPDETSGGRRLRVTTGVS
jgi:hypothetical protein